ncbi:hypothetical protein PFICI_08570 [Pestalotiopsis fici W106-1]|uniref:Uncharacterized protein n=1 Tax=Pestalotiopsis fici (strain W106-1 / CGMCC3.15140) TaxID=1229662 RepID=W3X022_PESFW|nr:uncharacterized protein PFICI_08570 [Pestalotiopsis fici W106-1]ETS78717.1 hypothetical protein PFICI_08570 [Pestalotiopsis fici W106-1]
MPYINPAGKYDLFGNRQRREFLSSARALMKKAEQLYPGQCYKMMTEVGEYTVIHPSLLNEIRNEPNLSFLKAFAANFHPHLPGFDGFAVGGRDDELIQRVIKKQLNKLLNQITQPLSEEAVFAMNVQLGNSTDWRQIPIKDALLDIVARLSSRVFLGDELCRNQDWLEIAKAYTVHAFLAAEVLRSYPSPIRSFIHWFLPECRILRKDIQEAKRIIGPVLSRRNKLGLEALKNNTPAPEYDDVFSWLEEESQGSKYDPVGAQLGFSLVAIHTTTDLACETMVRIAQNPEYFSLLRKEIVEALQAEGWKKSALFNMKLLDSVIKEAQRLKPITSAVINRVATKTVKLSDGTVIREGESCVGTTWQMYHPEVYSHPETFDGHRFERMRGISGLDSQAHLVSTSPKHLGFGLGLHACPGRFFAANEIKIILCHLLLKYEWRLVPERTLRTIDHGFALNSDPMAEIEIRSRNEIEIDL